MFDYLLSVSDIFVMTISSLVLSVRDVFVIFNIHSHLVIFPHKRCPLHCSPVHSWDSIFDWLPLMVSFILCQASYIRVHITEFSGRRMWLLALSDMRSAAKICFHILQTSFIYFYMNISVSLLKRLSIFSFTKPNANSINFYFYSIWTRSN